MNNSITQQRAAQKMSLKKTTACVSLLVFFRTRRGTFPYSVEDEASTKSQIPTTHYTNTCVKLTIVTHLSFSERIAIANYRNFVHPPVRGKNVKTLRWDHIERIKFGGHV